MAMNTALLVGKEDTYGTQATLTRAYAIDADPFRIQHTTVERTGRRAGQQGPRPAKRIVTGAEGVIGATEWLDSGMGLMLELMFPSVTGPVQQGGSTAYLTTATTGVYAPAVSHSVQMQREKASDETLTAFNYLGGMCPSWSFRHAVDGMLIASLDMDCQSGNRVQPGSLDDPVYVDGEGFHWGQLTVTVNAVGDAPGNARCVKDIEISGNNGLNVARRCMNGSVLKKQPRRAAQPTVGGTLNTEYESDDLYDLFESGEEVEIVATWTGEEIEAGYSNVLTMTVPRAEIIDDATPRNAPDDTPMQAVPFRAVHEGEATPMFTLTQQSADTAL